jgi:hypothetical protein
LDATADAAAHHRISRDDGERVSLGGLDIIWLWLCAAQFLIAFVTLLLQHIASELHIQATRQ